MAATTVRRGTAVPGLRAVTAISACSVAVPGTTQRGDFALRIAVPGRVSGVRPVTASAGSVLPGRLHRESLHPYLGVPRGRALLNSRLI